MQHGRRTHSQHLDSSWDAKMSLRKMASFESLPPEVYGRIVAYLHIAGDVAALSGTCRRVNALNLLDGWRIFCHTRFPTLDVQVRSPSLVCWRELAKAYTGLSLSWDRRALFATEIVMPLPVIRQPLYQFDEGRQSWRAFDVNIDTPSVARGHARGAGRQSTTFHPVIASRVEYSDDVTHAEETLAWSTGAELSIRVHRSGSYRSQSSISRMETEEAVTFATQENQFSSGFHDIVSLNLLASDTDHRSGLKSSICDILVTRANGPMHRLRISDKGDAGIIGTFAFSAETKASGRISVNCADTNRWEEPLLAAMSDNRLAVWDTSNITEGTLPRVETVIEQCYSQQVWTTKFLNEQRLLIGLGRTPRPLALYAITPTQLERTSTFGPGEADDVHAMHSVYAIQPVSSSSPFGGSMPGNVFLAGCFDGLCRLFDVRVKASPILVYSDPDNEAAVYSLAAFGQERFLVGSARGIVKIFDFRRNGKAYFHTDALPCWENDPSPPPGLHIAATNGNRVCKNDEIGVRHTGRHERSISLGGISACYHQKARLDLYRPNANIFFHGRNASSRQGQTAWRAEASRPNHIGPIYAISSPGVASSKVYVGVQGTVYDLLVSSGASIRHELPLTLYETGNGVGDIDGHLARLVPRLRRQKDHNKSGLMDRVHGAPSAMHRLETCWQDDAEFAGVQAVVNT